MNSGVLGLAQSTEGLGPCDTKGREAETFQHKNPEYYYTLHERDNPKDLGADGKNNNKINLIEKDDFIWLRAETRDGTS